LKFKASTKLYAMGLIDLFAARRRLPPGPSRIRAAAARNPAAFRDFQFLVQKESLSAADYQPTIPSSPRTNPGGYFVERMIDYQSIRADPTLPIDPRPYQGRLKDISTRPTSLKTNGPPNSSCTIKPPTIFSSHLGTGYPFTGPHAQASDELVPT